MKPPPPPPRVEVEVEVGSWCWRAAAERENPDKGAECCFFSSEDSLDRMSCSANARAALSRYASRWWGVMVVTATDAVVVVVGREGAIPGTCC